MSTPTLPAGWTPTQAGCLKTNDFWIWDNEELGDARTVLGGPSQTSNCLPSAWDATLTYDGTACPLHYTSACMGADSASAITCCPTAYAYTCLDTTLLSAPHAETFRCMSRHTTGGTIVVTRTALKANTIAVETRTQSTNQHLAALAIVYTIPVGPFCLSTRNSLLIGRQTSTTASSIASETPTSTSKASSTSLNSGEAAGIGVGAALAVLLIASGIAWFLWRRRRLLRPQAEEKRPISPLSPAERPAELPTVEKPTELSSVPLVIHELPAGN
ncbi:hypothetical protein GGR54DRAFT_598499 [Hypoxylon sp. NC1633]|nr:hypothetical protein GGR54DRAFT_598499 [Hypoxylon sp. NC1633]